MATFGELRTRLRNDVVVEADTSFFSDSDLLNFLVEASVEIASLGGFPVETASVSVSSGSTSFSLPATVSNVENMQVNFEGFQLDYEDLRQVRLYRHIGGAPRYYHYDPRSGGTTVDVAPAFNQSGSVLVEFVQQVDDSVGVNDEPWGGVLPDWHDTVLYWAAVKAFEVGMEFDKSEYYRAKVERRLQPLAIYLQNENLLNLTTMGGGSQE